MFVNSDIVVYKEFLTKNMANHFFDDLERLIPWKDILNVAGSNTVVKLKRKMAYAADIGVYYNYSNLQLPVCEWNGVLLFIKDRLEKRLNTPFNSVLLNRYQNGKDKINWHSDKESQLGENPIIPCVNLGATRTFWFMEKATGKKIGVPLSNGDLLVMGPNCQKNYLHAILPEKGVDLTRISLTYRYVYEN